MIDADILLDEICRDQCKHKHEDCDSACEIAAYVVNAPTVGGWISVKDRLPKPYEEVLFIGKNGFGNWYPIQKGFRIEREWYSSIHAAIINCVTHWMPLPKLPEEVSE